MGGGAPAPARMCVGNFSLALDPRPVPLPGMRDRRAALRGAPGSVVCAEVGHAPAREGPADRAPRVLSARPPPSRGEASPECSALERDLRVGPGVSE